MYVGLLKNIKAVKKQKKVFEMAFDKSYKQGFIHGLKEGNTSGEKQVNKKITELEKEIKHIDSELSFLQRKQRK